MPSCLRVRALRQRRIAIPCAGLGLALMSLLLVGAPCPAQPGYEPGKVQVRLVQGASIHEINARYQTVSVDSLPPWYLLSVPAGTDEGAMLDRMGGDSDLAEAERSYLTETPEAVRQMVVAAVGGTIEDYLDQNVVARLHLPEAHVYARGDGVLVAVLDTGVMSSHEALVGAIAPGGYDFVDGDDDPEDTGDGIDNDGDGLIDEGAGHGTLVAGTIRLVAPGAMILPVRVLDDEGRGTTFSVAKGINHAVERGARVINLSLGMSERVGIIAHEVGKARMEAVCMVSAAGNEGVDSLFFYPGSDQRVLMIAALDSSDVKAEFSCYNRKVDLSAPGVGIFGPFYTGEYAIAAGTSFAVPFVTGQAALLLGIEPGLDWSVLHERLEAGVEGIYDIPGNQPYVNLLGSGRMDALETIRQSPVITSVETPERRVERRIVPNPIPPGATASISWGHPASVSGAFSSRPRTEGSVYDARGRRVRLLHGPSLDGMLRWDGTDEAGRAVPAGAYFVRVRVSAPGERGSSLQGYSAWTGHVVLIR